MKIRQIKYDIIMKSKETQLHFPFLYEQSDKDWFMTYREGPHGVPGGDNVKCVQSHDGGNNWKPWEGLAPEPRLRWFRTRLKNGKYISHRYRLKKGVNDYYGYMFYSDDNGSTWIKKRCDVYGLSISNDYAYMWGHIKEDKVGNLYVVVYGKSEDKYINLIMISNDKGNSWNPYHYLGIDHHTFREGPNEGNIELLSDNDILAVYRTGGPLIYALSQNRGKNWHHYILDEAGVSPQLLKMNDIVICSYGTRDIKLRYFKEGLFSKPIEVYKGAGSGYTDIQKLSNNRFRIVFDQSDFNLKIVKDGIHKIVRVEYMIIR